MDLNDPYQVWFYLSIIWTLLLGIMFGSLRSKFIEFIGHFRETLDAIDDAIQPNSDDGTEISKEEVAKIITEARELTEATAGLVGSIIAIIGVKR